MLYGGFGVGGIERGIVTFSQVGELAGWCEFKSLEKIERGGTVQDGNSSHYFR